MPNEIKIRLVDDHSLKKINLYGKDHFYFEFNQDRFENQVILLMNLNEHWNNLELFKFHLWCKKNKIRVVTYGHFNEMPLLSLFSDAAIMFAHDKIPCSIYSGGSVYNYDSDVLHKIVTQEINGPGALSFLDFRRYEINPNLLEHFDLSHFKGAYNETFLTGHVIGLSKGYQNNAVKPYHILIDIAIKEISDEEVVEKYSFPEVWIKSSSLKIWDIMQKEDFIKNNFPPNSVMCEVKQQDSCGGKHLLNILDQSTRDHGLKFVYDWEKKKKMYELTGADNYMDIQVLGSFFWNWMWISYGGSAHIFSLLPLKVLSLYDQGVFFDLARKISLSRFGSHLGSIFPEFETLIYCMPGEKDGPSRTDGNPPLPDLYKLTNDLSKFDLPFKLIKSTILF